jgi:hypothetical protein
MVSDRCFPEPQLLSIDAHLQSCNAVIVGTSSISTRMAFQST